MQTDDDLFLWLEEIESEASLEWVKKESERTKSSLSSFVSYQDFRSRVKGILDNDKRIVFPSIVGSYLYNFWQDSNNPRGVWRRCSWESYLSGNVVWEILLDIDDLSTKEGIAWSFGGAKCLAPEYRLCVIALSRGGADAVELREFDLGLRQFVEGGFRSLEAKTSFAWIDENSILIGTDFGHDSMTESGYARSVRIWKRGTSIADAEVLFEVDAHHMGLFVSDAESDNGCKNVVVRHQVTFYDQKTYMFVDGQLFLFDIPNDCDVHVIGNSLVVYVREEWGLEDRVWPGGSVIEISIEEFLSGSRVFREVLIPSSEQTVESIAGCKSGLLVTVLDNVVGDLRLYTMSDGEWSFSRVETPLLGSVSVHSSTVSSDRYFFSSTGFSSPTTLYVGDSRGDTKQIQKLPDLYDTSCVEVEQAFAISKDGTRVPFFIVQKSGSGPSPTLLYGYGGFEVSLTPAYNPVTGALWVERGGTFVCANIRGGGEFGPQWHRSALRDNRQRAFEDFFAVAEELIRRGITTPSMLGAMGGSNGGLLAGVALTQRPELFGAIVIQVPLLDMRRFSRLLAGASWMAEYGDPDKEEDWEFISRYSPYHNLRTDVEYPPVLLTTTTRDDRVHPGHARKMAALLKERGKDYLYFESLEGGHGSGVTSEERSLQSALVYSFLWTKLASL